jgi:HK97 gp10 family phage protein
VANKVSVAVQGVPGLLNKVRLLVPGIRKGVQEAVARTALQVESDAKGLAPVDTGRLRSSIKADISPSGLSATVGTNVEYAVFVEFGTRRQAAQPFLGPAFEQNRLTFLNNLKAAGLKL